MSTTDFLPTRESELVTWSNAFTTRITAGTGANFGLSSIQTAHFETLNQAWVDLYTQATGHDTRTPAIIVAKDEAKEAMIENARELARIIQANPAVTNQQREALGLTVRDTQPSPVPIPVIPPVISIEETIGTNVKIRLRDAANPTSRAKPFGVYGAVILSAFGESAPLLSDPAAWTWKGTVTQTITTLEFPGAPSGTTVWITAIWQNTRGETGDPAQPISAQIPGQAAPPMEEAA